MIPISPTTTTMPQPTAPATPTPTTPSIGDGGGGKRNSSVGTTKVPVSPTPRVSSATPKIIIPPVEKPRMFALKKWIVILLAGLSALICILIILLSTVSYVKESDTQEHTDDEVSEFGILLAIVLLALVGELLGLIGAFCENLNLTLIYLIYTILGIGAMATYGSTQDRSFGGRVFWALVWVLLIVLFVWDLYQIKRERKRLLRLQLQRQMSQCAAAQRQSNASYLV